MFRLLFLIFIRGVESYQMLFRNLLKFEERDVSIVILDFHWRLGKLSNAF